MHMIVIPVTGYNWEESDFVLYTTPISYLIALIKSP